MSLTPHIRIFFTSLIVFAGCFSSSKVNAQSPEGHRATVVEDDSVYTLTVSSKRLKTNPAYDKDYYSFQNFRLIRQVGARGNTYLDGPFESRSYRTDLLFTKGEFTKGLKTGEWRSWYADGTLQSIENWEDGRRLGWAIFYTHTGALDYQRKYRKNGSYRDPDEKRRLREAKREEKVKTREEKTEQRETKKKKESEHAGQVKNEQEDKLPGRKQKREKKKAASKNDSGK